MTTTILTLDDLNLDTPDWDMVAVVSDNFEDQGDVITAQALRWLRDNKRWPTVFNPVTSKKQDFAYFYVCNEHACSCGNKHYKITYHHLPCFFYKHALEVNLTCNQISGCLNSFVEVFHRLVVDKEIVLP